MTVIDHPERVRARQRGELAARMVPVACELACLVRDSDRHAIGEFLRRLTPEETTALLVVQAAMIPVDQPAADLLSWVTWDDQVPDLCQERAPSAGPEREVKACGTYAAFRRHERAGELIDDACQEAADKYRRDRYQKRKAEKDAAGGGPGIKPAERKAA